VTAAGTVDPITLEIVESGLQAASDEMFAALRRTAMSAIIYEVLDAGTAITGPSGDLVSSGAGIPTFVAVLDKAVRRIVELNDGNVEPGDVFVTNDPYHGGVTHLNDVVLACPVFAQEELVAWTASIAHWNDVGGMAPGSVSTQAREIFQEGLRLPAVKVIARGEPLRPVIEIMRANSRLPDFLHGDLWAGVASVRVGERRVLELVEKFGPTTFEAAIRDTIDHGERVARSALAELPQGTFRYAEEQDDGAVYTVAVQLDEGRLLVDLRENPDQDDGPNNVSRDGAVIAAQMALMNLIGRQGSANAGHLRPLEVLTRPGSVFEPGPTAACSLYYEVRIALYDLILHCLAANLGDRLPAGSFASICGTFIGGTHPDTGRHFTIVEPEAGGWGASATRDGTSALFSPVHGDTFNCPAEVAEARYGLHVEQLRLSDAPGGEGEHRGGRGIVLDYGVRADDCFLTIAYRRAKHPAWPLNGGNEGSPNYVEVIRRDGRRERYTTVTALRVDAGDLIRIHTGNGGGYGDPRRRQPELVRADIRDGYLTEERAAAVYDDIASPR
jgi:N-methylhydantoinase B